MKAIEQYFPVVLFIMLYKVVVTFESVDEILNCDHSNESYWPVLSCGAVYYAIQGGRNFWVCGWNPKVWPFKWKLLSSTFLVLFVVRSIAAKWLLSSWNCKSYNFGYVSYTVVFYNWYLHFARGPSFTDKNSFCWNWLRAGRKSFDLRSSDMQAEFSVILNRN